MKQHIFDIKKYLGIWYELIHYRSWFQMDYNYNTQAEYILSNTGNIIVHNTTIKNGKETEIYGIATKLNDYSFHVDFFNNDENKSEPNYIIDRYWVNDKDEYIYAVVTDPYKNFLFVLSRLKNPPLSEYNILMRYVNKNFDINRIVQTPHYD
jgi:lipocalin